MCETPRSLWWRSLGEHLSSILSNAILRAFMQRVMQHRMLYMGSSSSELVSFICL